jgi:hypothetical protein
MKRGRRAADDVACCDVGDAGDDACDDACADATTGGARKAAASQGSGRASERNGLETDMGLLLR